MNESNFLVSSALLYRLVNNGDVVAFKMGRRQRREEGAYLNRYVTDEQRGRRPIFNATLWAGASWLFFRVARSTRMTQIWALRSRLEKQPTDLRRRHHYFRDGTLDHTRELSPREMASAIRVLVMDAVERAKSGHPGMPIGMIVGTTRSKNTRFICFVKPLLFIPVRQPKNMVVPGRQVEIESRGEEVVPIALVGCGTEQVLELDAATSEFRKW